VQIEASPPERQCPGLHQYLDFFIAAFEDERVGRLRRPAPSQHVWQPALAGAALALALALALPPTPLPAWPWLLPRLACAPR
jgi:hypothetical protein